MAILYEQDDNTIAIVNIPENIDVRHVIREHIPEGSQYVLIDESDLPNANDLSEFSAALRVAFPNNTTHFDISIAREITKERLRKERISFFEINDIKLRDAIIDDNAVKKTEAIQERDRLRDITLLPNYVSTLDELRNIHP